MDCRIFSEYILSHESGTNKLTVIRKMKELLRIVLETINLFRFHNG